MGHKKEYAVYARENDDNCGRPLSKYSYVCLVNYSLNRGDRGQYAYGARPPIGFYLVTIMFCQFRKYDTVAHSSMHFSRKYEACKSKTETLRDEN